MFIKKNTRSANFKKVVSFFIGLSLLSASCLNPLNSKVSAMENENFKKNKETNISINENQVPEVPPLQNNENHQLPLNEEINGGGNGGQENFQNEDSQPSNEGIINSNSESNEMNNKENQNLTNQNQTDLQNANSLLLETRNSYSSNETSQAINESNVNKEDTIQTNEDKNKITLINGETLKFEDVFNFSIKENNNIIYGSMVKKNYKKLIKEVSIPEFLNINNQQIKIVSIGKHAFSHCTELTKIIIPNSVLKIKSNAFMSCKNLTTIILPNSIVEIGSEAFHGCENLTTIVLPNTLATIKSKAFKKCTNLTTINLPNSIVEIGSEAFHGCENLTTIVLPNSMHSLEEGTFFSCGNLTNIILPNSINYIGKFTFGNCVSLTTIVFPDNGKFSFSKFENLKTIMLPNTIIVSIFPTTTINKLFSNCSFLKKTELVLPNSITRLHEETFYFCKNLKKVILPKSIYYIGKSAFSNCENLTTIVLPTTVTSIDNGAFENCYNLTIDFPRCLKLLGYGAFANCCLVDPEIPNYTIFGIGSFHYCNNLLTIIKNQLDRDFGNILKF